MGNQQSSTEKWKELEASKLLGTCLLVENKIIGLWLDQITIISQAEDMVDGQEGVVEVPPLLLLDDKN